MTPNHEPASHAKREPISLPFGKRIGGGRAFVIAEIGSNHGSDLQRALETIDAAAEAGADAAKFQSLSLHDQWYQPSSDVEALHRKIDLDESWYSALIERCQKNQIIFFSTPTYFRAIDLLEETSVALYKLASAQVGTFPQLVEKVAATQKPVILSTGIVTTDELDNTVEIFRRVGNHDFAILHCNSIYPTPPEKVHLPRMHAIAKRYDCFTGFSDHTDGITIPVAAVAQGATIIEKHFLLDDKIACPDRPFSLDPKSFSRMVEQIRMVEQASIPAAREQLEPEEQEFKSRILQKLILKRPKAAGTRFQLEDFEFLRHPDGIDCRDLNVVTNQYRAAGELPGNHLLRWDHLKKVTEAEHEQESLGHRA